MAEETIYEDWSFLGVTVKNVPKARNEFFGYTIKGNVMLNLMKLVDEAKKNKDTTIEYRLV